jgi:hypothetical protein
MATIDRQRQGIKLLIRNTGRTSGTVSLIDLFERNRRENVAYNKVEFSGFPSGQFKSMTIPAYSKTILVINAKDQTTIPKRIRLHVHAGAADAAKVKPVKVLRRRAIYKTEPVWPPGGPPA